VVNSDYSRLSIRRRQFMESFVLAGKARTVFKLVELLAKAEKSEKTPKKASKK